jgi:hypothetical protein
MTGRTDVILLASLSIVFYGLLAITAVYYYRKFYIIQTKNPTTRYYRSNVGKFDDAKAWFFLILAICALSDIPLFVGCLAMDGPRDCEWNNPSYPVLWFLHIAAIWGYAYTIIIPCLLWSDMINKKDGKLFLSKFPADWTKRFFQLSFLAYFVATAINCIFAGIFYQVSDHNYYNGTIFYNITELSEPILIFLIAVGCLWCGIRLQLYVRCAKLGLFTELRFLLHMNVTMAIITVTYLVRALFILRLLFFTTKSYKEAFASSYFVWLICTRWLPYVFCSFCLVYTMRASGEEVAARQGNARIKKPHSHSQDYLGGIFDTSSTREAALKMFSFVSGGIISSGNNSGEISEEAKNSGHNSSILSQLEYPEDDSFLSQSLLSEKHWKIDRTNSESYIHTPIRSIDMPEEPDAITSYSPPQWGGILSSTNSQAIPIRHGTTSTILAATGRTESNTTAGTVSDAGYEQ